MRQWDNSMHCKRSILVSKSFPKPHFSMHWRKFSNYFPFVWNSNGKKIFHAKNLKIFTQLTIIDGFCVNESWLNPLGSSNKTTITPLGQSRLIDKDNESLKKHESFLKFTNIWPFDGNSSKCLQKICTTALPFPSKIISFLEFDDWKNQNILTIANKFYKIYLEGS